MPFLVVSCSGQKLSGLGLPFQAWLDPAPQPLWHSWCPLPGRRLALALGSSSDLSPVSVYRETFPHCVSSVGPPFLLHVSVLLATFIVIVLIYLLGSCLLFAFLSRNIESSLLVGPPLFTAIYLALENTPDHSRFSLPHVHVRVSQRGPAVHSC